MSSDYFAPESRKVVVLWEVTLDTNLPNRGIAELVEEWHTFISSVVKHWEDSGTPWDKGVLRFTGSGSQCRIVPWGASDIGKQIWEWQAEVLEAVEGAETETRDVSDYEP